MDRAQLLAVKPDRVKRVEIPGIGEICIRVLSGREALSLEVAMRKDRETADGLADLVAAQLAAFICDESGASILSTEDAAQLVGQWSANQVRAVIREGTKLNALGAHSVEEAGGN